MDITAPVTDYVIKSTFPSAGEIIALNASTIDFVKKSTFPTAAEIAALEASALGYFKTALDVGLAAGKHLLLPADGKVKVNAIPVSGFFIDGTPMYKKLINIGDWNMVLNASMNIAHGIINWKQIIGIDIFIRNDTDTTYYNLFQMSDIADPNLLAGGIVAYNATTLFLSRRTNGLFHNTGFDSIGYNRGYVVITYI